MRPHSFASPARTARTTRTKRKPRRNEADLPVTGGRTSRSNFPKHPISQCAFALCPPLSFVTGARFLFSSMLLLSFVFYYLLFSSSLFSVILFTAQLFSALSISFLVTSPRLYPSLLSSSSPLLYSHFSSLLFSRLLGFLFFYSFFGFFSYLLFSRLSTSLLFPPLPANTQPIQ